MKRINESAANELGEFLAGEFLNSRESRKPDDVQGLLIKYRTLAGYAGQDTAFIQSLTHLGNNVQSGVRPDASEGYIKKIIRRATGETTTYEAESKSEFLGSLTGLLEYLANIGRIDNSDTVLDELKGLGKIKPSKFRYSNKLIFALKDVADKIVVE